MSANNTQETEQLIIKLLRKLERKGKHIQSFLWKLMEQFEDEQIDQKNDDKEANIDSKISLLAYETAPNVCQVGHYIQSDEQKHLSIEPCIVCGHRNNDNAQNKMTRNHQQMLTFVNSYNINQIPFGPNEENKRDMKTMKWSKKWPLHYAAVTGDIAKISQLCRNKNINVDQKKTDYNDQTPITFASRYGQLNSVIELIKHGANAKSPPDKFNQTPYKASVYNKHKSITAFYNAYIKYLYNFDINDIHNPNLECYQCYIYDLHFNQHIMDGTMSKYIYCQNCTVENVKKVKKKQQTNVMISSRIIKTIKENPSISVDTLCQMKDVKSLHSILKEIMVSGEPHAYWLWLLDIDNFKAINTHLTHAIADTKIQALGQVLKKFEPMTWTDWRDKGMYGLIKVHAFRQGGDEFALVTYCNAQYINVLQKFYEMLRNNINQIKLGKKVRINKSDTMEHITVSIGVCHGQAISNYEDMMKNADDVAERVKKSGKNGIAIYFPQIEKIYKNFNEI